MGFSMLPFSFVLYFSIHVSIALSQFENCPSDSAVAGGGPVGLSLRV